MHIINFVLALSSALALASGIVVFFGAVKKRRGAAFAYLMALIGAASWAFSMFLFLRTAPGDLDRARVCLIIMYVSALLDTSMLFLYVGWRSKVTWLFSGVFIMLMAWLSISIAIDPSRLFAEITLDPINGNSVVFANSFYTVAYMVICVVFVVAFTIAAAISVPKARSKQERRGTLILLVGLIIAGGFGAFFDLLLPLQGNYSLIWIGPVATAIAVLFYYYATLKYQLVSLTSRGIKIFSYITLVAIVAAIYFALFFIIFFAIFRSNYPSIEVIILNCLMVAAILLFTPIINEITAFARSLIYINRLDLPYITKKLTGMIGEKAVLSNLAGFLSSYLHFEYVGFLLGDRLYGSGALDITNSEIKELKKLGKAEYNVWQDLPASTAAFCDRLEIKAVGELKDDNGKTIGQLVLARPQGRRTVDKKELRELGIVAYFVSAIFSANPPIKK